MSYEQGTASRYMGSFHAPFTGIHGWYLKNDSGHAVTARLEIAGFYERTDQ